MSFWGHFGDDVGSTLGSPWTHFRITLDRISKHFFEFFYNFLLRFWPGGMRVALEYGQPPAGLSRVRARVRKQIPKSDSDSESARSRA